MSRDFYLLWGGAGAEERLGRDLAEKKQDCAWDAAAREGRLGVFDWLLPVCLHLSEQLERTRKSRRKLERQEILVEETSLFFLP